MIDISAYFVALAVMLALAAAGWWHSYRRNNVTIVDSLWALFFVVGLAGYAASSASMNSARSSLVLGLVVLWAARLATYLTWRNWGKSEDHRYAQIRLSHLPLRDLGDQPAVPSGETDDCSGIEYNCRSISCTHTSASARSSSVIGP